MSRKSRPFLFGVFVLFIASIAVKLLGLINYVVLINIKEFGDRGIGLYSAGFTIYMVLLALSTMGFPAAISKMIAESIALGEKRKAHRIFKVSFYFLAIIGAICTLLLLAFSGFIAEFIKMPGTVYSVIALAPTIFFVAIMCPFRGYFQGMQDMIPQAVSQFVEQIFKLLFSIVFVLILLPYGVEKAAAGATFGTTAGAICGVIYLFLLYRYRRTRILQSLETDEKDKKYIPEKSSTIVRNLLRLAIPISLGAIILTISSFIDLATVADRLLYAGFSGEEAEKMYGQLAGKCQQLVNFPVALNMAIATAIIPAIAGSTVIKDFKDVEKKIKSSLRLTMIIAIPAAIGMSVLSQPILNIIYPNQNAGANILQVLSFSIIFMALSQTLAGVLQGLGKVKVTALSLLAGATVKLIVNFTLVPIHNINIIGAAYGSIACYVVSSAINYIALKRTVKFKTDNINVFIKPLFAAIAMGFLAHFQYIRLLSYTGSNIISLLVTISISALAFGAILILSRAISYDDLKEYPLGNKLADILLKMRLIS